MYVCVHVFLYSLTLRYDYALNIWPLQRSTCIGTALRISHSGNITEQMAKKVSYMAEMKGVMNVAVR